MTKDQTSTRDRIVTAASALFYSQGIRAVSVDAVAEKAGLTKRTLYYHFKSKDDLITAYLTARDQPNLALFRQWFESADGSVADGVQAIFLKLEANAKSPRWKGCGFLRTAAELANLPGHAAIAIGSAHKKQFEAWLAEQFSEVTIAEPTLVAQQIGILLDGAFSTAQLHRDPAYFGAAGKAAAMLINAALPRQSA